MEIGVELITESGLAITTGHNFRLELYAGEILLPPSTGTDVYNSSCRLPPKRIVAATGRKAEAAASGGKAAVPIPLAREQIPLLKIRLINNAILDQAELKRAFSLQIRLNDNNWHLPLNRFDVKVYWQARGEFLVPLGEHLEKFLQTT